MFSVVPGRDQATGDKIVTDDNDGSLDPDEDAANSASNTKGPDGKVKCKYGEMCYQVRVTR